MPAGRGREAPTITREDVTRALHELYIAAEGTALRREDLKKVEELTGLLRELLRVGRPRVLVDAAAGKAYAGVLAGGLLGARRVVVIEREAARLEACRRAAGLRPSLEVTLCHGDVGDADHWPEAPDLVVALHACGPASDAVLEASVRSRARWLFLVPCCYADAVPFALPARALADRLGVPDHAEVRRRFLQSVIDAERTLRLEAAGYEVTVVPFVAPTVTPHNLLWRARRSAEPGRMRAAGESLAALRAHAGVEA